MNEFDMAVDEFLDDNNIHCFEGDTGIANFEKLIEAIGYQSHPFKYGDLITVFLADNPGAIEKLVEFIKEQNVPEWNDNLCNMYEDEEDEERDTE